MERSPKRRQNRLEARTWLLSLSFTVCTACSTTATIRRSNGPNYEASILKSDAQAVYVLGSNGRLYPVPRAEVVAIDHPGNVKATIGALLIATGIIVGIGTYNDSHSPEPPAVATAWGLVWAGPGAILLGTGLFTYLASRRNTDSFAQPVAAPSVAQPPPCLPPGYGWPPPPVPTPSRTP